MASLLVIFLELVLRQNFYYLRLVITVDINAKRVHTMYLEINVALPLYMISFYESDSSKREVVSQ